MGLYMTLQDLLTLKNPLYRLAMSITHNSQEAEDVVQDVIIKLWQKSQRDAMDEVPTSLAYKMTRNLAIDRARLKDNNTENIDGMDFSAASGTEQSIERQERIDLIRKAMLCLPEKQRSIMQLRDFEEKSYKDIADILEISEDQVRVSLHRARKAVKEKLCPLT